MTVWNDRTDLSGEVVEEYLLAAEICLNTMKPGGGVLGYPAVLLLLCVVDAIGQGQATSTSGTRMLY